MDDVGKLIALGLTGLVLLFFVVTSCTVQKQHKFSVLDTRISLKVYGAEILESVIIRMDGRTTLPIAYSTTMLLPYKAKAREYREATLKEILDDQLAGTPIKYQVQKRRLLLFNAETGDYRTNILSGKR